jgi:hypothetical protein
MLSALTRPYNQLAQTLENASFEAYARKQAMTRSQALEFVTPHYLAKLHELREHLTVVARPSEEKTTRLAFVDHLIARLRNDPVTALEVGHRCGLQEFETALNLVKKCLPKTEKCRRMLDPVVIGRLCGRPPQTDSVANAITVLENCPVAFPYRLGFNASVQWPRSSGGLPLISCFRGVGDSIEILADLVVSYCTEPVSENQDGIRFIDLRTRPQELKEATSIFRSTLDIINGGRLTVEYNRQRYNRGQRTLLSLLSGSARFFVWFHEFAHVLTVRLPDPKQNELQCDEFSIRLMFATGNEESMIGVGLGLLSMATWVHTSVAELGMTHPDHWERLQQYMSILDETSPTFDKARVGSLMELFTIPLTLLT